MPRLLNSTATLRSLHISSVAWTHGTKSVVPGQQPGLSSTIQRCYRHTGVRRSHGRHGICAFRNLLSVVTAPPSFSAGQLTAFAAAEDNRVQITAEATSTSLFCQRRYRQSFAQPFCVRQNLRHLVLWITGNGLTVDLPFLTKETVVALGIDISLVFLAMFLRFKTSGRGCPLL